MSIPKDFIIYLTDFIIVKNPNVLKFLLTLSETPSALSAGCRSRGLEEQGLSADCYFCIKYA